jgi:transcriptional regulator with GAF, ATPase, and Fis domain
VTARPPALEVALRFGSGESPSRRRDVTAALEAAGVKPSLVATADDAPAVVYHSAASLDADRTVAEVAMSGMAPVIAVSGSPLDRRDAWRLIAAGATDLVTWTGSETAVGIAARVRRWQEVATVTASPAVQAMLVGRSPAWTKTLRGIVEAALFTDASVLLIGESGTGKELAARLIHQLDARRDKRDFVVVDCTTVVPTLSGSEFFGHEKGAFTGAVTAREGAFAMANGGTLFLDEVSELPLQLQAELLRVTQEGVYKRVGSDSWRSTSFRLVCASNRDLLEEQAAGRFRRDLYHRIAGWVFHLPSLHERKEDILLLARHFLIAAARGAVTEFDSVVTDLLQARDYPGNIRDLKQLVARIAARHTSPGPVTIGDVPPEDRVTPAGLDAEPAPSSAWKEAVSGAVDKGLTLREIAQQAAEIAVGLTLSQEGGSLKRAARRLGVTERALQLRRASMRLRALSGVSPPIPAAPPRDRGVLPPLPGPSPDGEPEPEAGPAGA